MHDVKSAGQSGYRLSACQICGNSRLKSVLFLGYLPPVNVLVEIGRDRIDEDFFPTELLHCERCDLVQLGAIMPQSVVFPADYPYTSGTTQILRDNFADLRRRSDAVIGLKQGDLVVDIGSNDGTLLSNFSDSYSVLGIEPTNVANLAEQRGIRSLQQFFKPEVAAKVVAEFGKAKLVTATNCFAHIADVHAILDGIGAMLSDDGVFVSESHYLVSLIDTLQYDTIYHEHLRYYSLGSLQYLLQSAGWEIIHAERIPTHGGSIRVFAARKGTRSVSDTVANILQSEPKGEKLSERLAKFGEDTARSKLKLWGVLAELKGKGARICAISAPSRSATLANYVGLDDQIIDYVCEIKGSLKIGKYLPGTRIPILEESVLYEKQPDYALMFSWHIADELAGKIRSKGYNGEFIVPLPEPHLI